MSTRVAGNIVAKIIRYGELAEQDPAIKAIRELEKTDPHAKARNEYFRSQFYVSKSERNDKK